MYKILGITGPSGCGKDSAARYLANKYPNEYNYVKLYTTRPKRSREEDTYYFVQPLEFLDYVLDGSMLNAQEFNDWYYGLRENSLDENKINVLPMNYIIVEQMIEEGYSNCDLKVFYIETDDNVRLMNILQREKHPDCHEICRRFLEDEKDYTNNKELWNRCNHFLVNRYTQEFFSNLEWPAYAAFEPNGD